MCPTKYQTRKLSQTIKQGTPLRPRIQGPSLLIKPPKRLIPKPHHLPNPLHRIINTPIPPRPTCISVIEHRPDGHILSHPQVLDQLRLHGQEEPARTHGYHTVPLPLGMFIFISISSRNPRITVIYDNAFPALIVKFEDCDCPSVPGTSVPFDISHPR